MKKITHVLLFTLLALFASAQLNAQSVRWADGNEYVRKLSNDSYTRVPTGAFTYQITDNSCWEILNGEKAASPMAHYVNQGDRLYYYKGEDVVGYYVPSQGRYVQVEVKSGKEFSFAVLQADGELLDANARLRYTVESGFSPEILGFFLFF